MAAETSVVPVTATLGVRPHRVAVLVPNAFLGWQKMFTGAITTQTRWWGGSQNLVFPFVDDLAERELFWRLLDVFDPDHFVIHTGARGDLEYLDPAGFAEARRRIEADLPDDDPETIDRLFNDWRELQLFDTPELPAGLEELITRRIAPLHGDATFAFAGVGGMQEPLFPMTDVAMFTTVPNRVVDVSTTLGDLEGLLLAVEVGRLPPGLRSKLLERGIAVQQQALGERASWRMFMFRQREDRNYPFRLTELGLEWYRTGPPLRGPIPIVVGDDPWDFALFYALRRWRAVAYWVPTSKLGDEEFCRNVLTAAELHGRAARTIAVVSTDSNGAQRGRDALREVQQRLGAGGLARLELQTADWREVLPAAPSRLFERDNFGLPQPVLVHGGRTPELPTPVPRQVRMEHASDLCWLTDVRLEEWSALRNRYVGRELIDVHGYDENYVRAGSDGVGYHCPRFFSVGRPSLETLTVRPRLRPVPLFEQLAQVLGRQGWSATPSDKGVYASESVNLFGGVAELAGALRDEQTRLVLDAYQQERDGPGKFLKPERRRYLTLADLGSVLGNADAAAALLATLEPREVLRRGVILKCRRCRATAFYSAADFEPTFRCARCRLDQVPDRWSWLSTVEPQWYYRLDEVVFMFMQANGHLPLLASFDRFHNSREAVTYAFELEVVSPDGEQSELDIVLADGARLWVGEATIADQFAPSTHAEQERLSRLAAVAAALDAYGVLLVSEQTFTSRTKGNVGNAFPSFWPRVEYRESVTLGV